MAMQAHQIEALIRAAFPTAKIAIDDLAGDGNHYAATVVAEEFRGLKHPFKIKDDSFFTAQAKTQGVNIGKRLALLIAPGATLADSQGKTYKQIFLTDSPQMSENSEYLISLYYGKEALNRVGQQHYINELSRRNKLNS